ncbi:hypothetical protein LshimejAT787_0112040 [Lyophyllum shimeji]|uniref:Uncharacterized protein n=1 Tax=Lyophyllum shimeji TaxID=47721 RepID=A0A9P3PE75_LYOSH|nr:hypothetical protein LshimejAT787_0112040 [Lyophyllum shimeji]
MSWWDDSTNYAAPVSRDGFFYDGLSFYVDIDSYHYPRSDPAALYELLTYTDPGPVLTKTGKVAKRQPPPRKDKPPNYYQAQCLHYGLKGFKQRPAAKKHLLAAFDPTTKTLVVPPRILALEQELKEEYEKANEVARVKAEEEWQRREGIRQAEQKRRETQLEEEWRKNREESDAMLGEFAALGIVIGKGEIEGTESDNEVLCRKSKEVSDAELRKDIAALSEAQLRAVFEKLVFDKRTRGVRKAALREIDVVKQAQASKVQMTKGKSKKRLNALSDEGEFRIMAPYLRDQWSSYTETMKLKLSPSPGGSHLWVWFHFGIVSGIMRSHGCPPKYVGDTTRLQWRGREEGEGEMTYEDENVASITFLGDGRIRGKMRWMGTLFEFIGKNAPRKNVVWCKSVQHWKEQYWGINDRSYERARVARWGRSWHYDDDAGDASSNSDTVGDPYAGDGDSDDEDDERMDVSMDDFGMAYF